MEIVKGANLGLRFLLELLALAALAYWGVNIGASPLTRVVFGVSAPLIAVVIWGTFVSPRAPVRLSRSLHLLVQVLFFGAAVAALTSTGRPVLAWLLGGVASLNAVLLMVWEQ